MTSQPIRQAPMHSPGADAQPAAGRDVVRTACGREFAIGELHLERVGHPTARVSLSTRLLPQDVETLWASLTAHEARELAAHLLAHAAAAEPAEPARGQTIDVIYLDPQRYSVRLAGQHPFLTALDNPADGDVADLLAASVALELAHRAERFLSRHETRREGLRVQARRPREDEGRTLRVTIATPPSLSRERRNALQTLLSRSVRRDRPRKRHDIEITVC